MNYFSIVEAASRDMKLDILQKKWYELTARYNPSIKHSDTREHLFYQMVNADPTKNKQYLQWIMVKGVKNWINKGYSLFEEDLKTIKSMLEQYDDLKRMNKLSAEHKDINRIKDDVELFDVVTMYSPHKGRTKEQDKAFFSKKGAKRYYEDSNIEIIIPLSAKASCYFGSNTKWCTAREDIDNAFATYNREGPLYIITEKKSGKKYQFFFGEESEQDPQFMDAKDNPINWQELYKNESLISSLRKAFKKQAKTFSFLPLLETVREVDVKNYLNNLGFNLSTTINHLKTE